MGNREYLFVNCCKTVSMRMFFLNLFIFLFCASSVRAAEDNGIELGGMKSKAPKNWVKEPTKSEMRLSQFRIPKEEGDSKDSEMVIFFFRSGSGSPEDNMKRQLKNFEPAEGQKEVENKVSKINIGKTEATYQVIKGTYLDKFPPFAPNPKITPKPNFVELYVILKLDSGEYYL